MSKKGLNYNPNLIANSKQYRKRAILLSTEFIKNNMSPTLFCSHLHSEFIKKGIYAVMHEHTWFEICLKLEILINRFTSGASHYKRYVFGSEKTPDIHLFFSNLY